MGWPIMSIESELNHHELNKQCLRIRLIPPLDHGSAALPSASHSGRQSSRQPPQRSGHARTPRAFIWAAQVARGTNRATFSVAFLPFILRLSRPSKRRDAQARPAFDISKFGFLKSQLKSALKRDKLRIQAGAMPTSPPQPGFNTCILPIAGVERCSKQHVAIGRVGDNKPDRRAILDRPRPSHGIILQAFKVKHIPRTSDQSFVLVRFEPAVGLGAGLWLLQAHLQAGK
jgi:hypothetical protein